jgi:hypothetical protein
MSLNTGTNLWDKKEAKVEIVASFTNPKDKFVNVGAFQFDLAQFMNTAPKNDKDYAMGCNV